MTRFALIVGALASLAFADAQPSFAIYEGPWCMHMSMGRGTVISRCDMRSYEMCRTEMSGLGGNYCTQNPYYWAAAKQAAGEPKRRKARKQHH